MAAAGNIGVPNVKILNPEFKRAHSFGLQSSWGANTWAQPRAKKYGGIALPRGLKKPVAVFCVPTSSESATNSEVASEERKSSQLRSDLIPNAQDVEYLVSELCDTTSVAEFELKLDGFHLHITRSLAENLPLPAVPSASASAEAAAEAPAQNGSVMSTSLAIVKSEPYERKGDKLLDKAADEGLVLIMSPKVGFFRRSRMLKKKRIPPPCKEGQIVKEGQTLCFIDQLGGQFPVEATVAGEVVRFLLEDDDPVGYGDAVVAILPSFPGIKKLPLDA